VKERPCHSTLLASYCAIKASIVGTASPPKDVRGGLGCPDPCAAHTRIGAGLFVEARWIGVELSSIATQELAPYSEKDEERVRIDGPHVLLEPDAAQAIAVALNELATNDDAVAIGLAGKDF
jgi:hypothetical protein